MTREAIHFVIASREHTVAARKAGVDDAHHADHLARRLFLVIAVGGHVPLYMAIRALYAQGLIEAGHDEGHVRVRRKHLQVLVGGGRTAAAARWLLCDERDRREKPHEENPHE